MLSKRRYFKRQTPRDYRIRVKKSPFSRHSNHRNTSRDPDTKLSGSRELGIGYKFMSSQYLLLQHTSHIFGKKLVLHYPYSLSCHLPVYHLAKKTCKRKECPTKCHGRIQQSVQKYAHYIYKRRIDI